MIQPIRPTRGAKEVDQSSAVLGVVGYRWVGCGDIGTDRNAKIDENVQSDERCGEPQRRDGTNHSDAHFVE